MMSAYRLLFENMDVGTVEDVRDGKIFFEPFRGSGHYELATTMGSVGTCEAVLIQAGGELSIHITGYPEYGVLEFSSAGQE